MTLRPKQVRKPAKKITRETLRENPLLRALARQRAKELRDAKREDVGKGQQDLLDSQKHSD